MQRYLIVLFLACISLAGCAQEEIAPPPTLAPSPTVEIITAQPSPTELKRATLPPTWTPVQEVTPTVAEAAATLIPSDTPIPPPTPLEVCNTFNEDRTLNKRTFIFGESPTVYWTPVQGAAQYSITLVDATNTALKVDYTADTKYTFDASLFEKGKMYGWEAYPIDNIGQQMCIARGAELTPQQS